MGAPNHWVCFVFFLRELMMLWPPVLVQCFRGLFVWVVSQLDGGRSMSPLFRKVHRLPLLLVSNRFPFHQYCQWCLSLWCRFVSEFLWNSVVCFEAPSLLIGKVWVPMMHFLSAKCIGEWAVGQDRTD